MPHSVSMEMTVLGGVLLDNGALVTALSMNLISDDFYIESHRDIFNAILSLNKNGEEFDMLMVGQKLAESGRYKLTDGTEYLGKMQDEAVTSANIKAYIRKIKELANLRRVIYAVMKANKLLWEDFDGPLKEKLEESRRIIIEATSIEELETIKPIMETLMPEMERIEAIKTGRLERPILKTGLIDLDGGLLRIKQAKLVILAARPSVGKTAFALNYMYYLARHLDIASLYFSVDDDKETANQRLIARAGDVPYEHLLEPAMLTEDDISGMNNAARKIHDVGNKIFFDYSSMMTPIKVKTRCQLMKEKAPIKVCFVDFLGKLRPDSEERGKPYYKVVGDICSNLKDTGQELDLAMIVLCQIGRDIERRDEKDPWPRLSDLRDSGDIEIHADVVMFLSCNQVEKEKDYSIINCNLAKQKAGKIGRRKLFYDKVVQKFGNYSEGNGVPF